MNSRKIETSLVDVVDVGVDWITATSKNVEDHIEFCRAIAPDGRFSANGWKPMIILGYRGTQKNGVFVGESESARPWAYMVQLRGQSANEWWREIKTWRWRRIDTQITVRLPEPHDVVGELYSKKKLKSMIMNLDGGKTGYINSRQSARFGRIYDKGIESPGKYVEADLKGIVWRYEAEWKDEAAEAVQERIISEAKDERSTIMDVTTSFFLGKGIDVPVSEFDSSFKLVVQHPITDSERSLNWLEKSVRRTVSQLVREGRRTEVMIALGLDVWEGSSGNYGNDLPFLDSDV